MNDQQRRPKTPSASSDGDDKRAEQEIRQGIIKALKHRALKEKVQLPPQKRNDLLEELFPKISEEDTAKELTRAEYDTLRASLQEVVQAEVKEKMFLLREQLSEYHSVLEDVIVYKSRCERLEQDKEDLVSLCQDVCQVRDRKIELLEKELAHLRNERRCSSSTSDSSSDWVSSIMSGGSCGSGGSEDRQSHAHHPQLNHPHQTQALTSTQRLSRINSYSNESRRVTLTQSPPSIKTGLQDLRRGNGNAVDFGAIQPLPFQVSRTQRLQLGGNGQDESSSAIMFPQVGQKGSGAFDNYDWWNRSTKKHKRS